MTERDERPAASNDSASDAIDRLLRLAGSRPAGDAERMRRVHDAVHGAWRDSLRTRHRRRALGAFVLAAAAVVIAAWLGRRVPSPAPAPLVVSAARRTACAGTLERLDDAGGTARVGDEAAVGSAFETGSAVLATFAFTGGGELRMNEGTAVRFIGPRELQLERGAIYLDSGPRSGSLIVRTPVGAVRDVGTRFEVGALTDVWRVRVREGVVRYEGAVRQEATAGSELIVQTDGHVIERPSSTYGAEWAWVVRAAPAFQVEGQTLAAFLDWVTRESGRRVEFSSDELRRTASGTILHGSIEGLTPEDALEVILPTCGLSHRMESERVVVSRPRTQVGGLR